MTSDRIYSRIAGTGSYLPEKVLTNDDLSKIVDTNDEWIAARTGIRERHIAAEGETTSDLAFHAATRAMDAAGVAASEIDLIIVGTTTPDIIFPSTACLLQARLGANGCGAFDVNAACSGFLFALSVADKFIRSGDAKTVLVVGAEGKGLSRLVREHCQQIVSIPIDSTMESLNASMAVGISLYEISVQRAGGR